ncbi:hypothetical protein FRB90_008192 [Tulasnella sp. 427]|nr:hypothetical protein FRB90_008192 [Tulasnella sp. 427]
MATSNIRSQVSAEDLQWPFLPYYYRKPLGDNDPEGAYASYKQSPKYGGGAMHEFVIWELLRDCLAESHKEETSSQNVSSSPVSGEIARLDRNLAYLWAAQTAIGNELTENIARVATRRNSLLPIHQISVEILSHILEESLDSFDGESNPGTIQRLIELGSVSRWWRDVLDESPSLWGQIDNLEYMPLALRKSRNTPLSINLMRQGALDTVGMKRALSLLSSCSIRWRALQVHLKFVTTGRFDDVLESLSAPLLRDLRLKSEIYFPLLLKTRLNRFSLRRLEVEGVSILLRPVAELEGLEHLSISSFGLSADEVRFPRDHIIQILLSCTRLRVLTLAWLEYHPDDNTLPAPITPTIHLPALESLALQKIRSTRETAVWLLESINAPNLKGLSVTVPEWKCIGSLIGKVLRRQTPDSPLPVALASCEQREIQVQSMGNVVRITCAHTVEQTQQRGVELYLPVESNVEAHELLADLAPWLDRGQSVELDIFSGLYDTVNLCEFLAQLPSLRILRTSIEAWQIIPLFEFLSTELSIDRVGYPCQGLVELRLPELSITTGRSSNKIRDLVTEGLAESRTENTSSENMSNTSSDIEIARMDRDLAYLVAALGAIQNEFAEITAQVAARRNSLLPIHRLSLEILSQILGESLDGYSTASNQGTTPRLIALASVSRSWKDVLDESPCLWGRIDRLEYTPLALRKSRNAPLSIDLMSEKALDQATVERALSWLSPCSLRWRNLHAHTQWSAAKRFGERLGSLSLPFLQDIRLSSEVTYHAGALEIELGVDLFSLRLLHLKGISIPWAAVGRLEELRELAVSWPQYRNNQAQSFRVGFIHFLSSCPQLEVLSLGGLEDLVVHTLPPPVTPTLPFPALKSLALHDIHSAEETAVWLLESIVAPNLTGLSVEGALVSRIGLLAKVLRRQTPRSPLPVVLGSCKQHEAQIELDSSGMEAHYDHNVQQRRHSGVELSVPFGSAIVETSEIVSDLVDWFVGGRSLVLMVCVSFKDVSVLPNLLRSLSSLQTLRIFATISQTITLLETLRTEMSEDCIEYPCSSLIELQLLEGRIETGRDNELRHAARMLLKSRPNLTLYDANGRYVVSL